MMTTLNGLPRSWDSFIQGIYGRKKLVKFSRLWEECSQEEARIATREEKMGSEYQALTVHSKKGRRENHHHQGKHSLQKNNVVRRDSSRLRCYTCDEIGHFSRNCPKNKNGSKKKRNLLEQGPAATGKAAISGQGSQRRQYLRWLRRESSTTALKAAAERRELNHCT